MPEDRAARLPRRDPLVQRAGALPATLVQRAQELLAPTPFGRLARTHLVTMCADACVAVSLAGSLFFQKPSSGARGSILLYLLLTIAPFAIVAPIIGPALDRISGGRRLLVVGSCLGRAALCFILAFVVTKSYPEGLLVYPFAFGILVLSKGYSVARSSLVPALVDEGGSLVRANSRLAIISAVAALIGGAPAALVQWGFGADWSVRLAMVVFIAAALFALRIPRTRNVIDPHEQKLARAELHQPSILLAGSAMAILRGAMGFLQFFAAFTFKTHLVSLGFVMAGVGVGLFAGNFIAPTLRDHVREELMLVGALLVSSAATFLGVLTGSTFGMTLAFFAVGLGASSGKIAFDSLLQRDGPDAVRGRAFALFETRFQAAWVVGALLGIIPVAIAAGLGVLGIVLAFGGLSYLAALRAARTQPARSKLRPDAVDRALGRARDNLKSRRPQTKAGRRKAAAHARPTRRARRGRGEPPPPAEPEASSPPRRISTPQPRRAVPPPPRRRSR
jgi:predicted MFS family arabinose efflux permease